MKSAKFTAWKAKVGRLSLLNVLTVVFLCSSLAHAAGAPSSRSCKNTLSPLVKRPRILKADQDFVGVSQDPKFIKKYRDLKWIYFSSSENQGEMVDKLRNRDRLSGVTINDLLNQDGQMVVFRSIVGSYDSRFDGGPESEGGQMFATPNPMSAFFWGGRADETILVMIQEPIRQRARGWPVGPREMSHDRFNGRVLLNKNSAFEQVDYEIVFPPRTGNVALKMTKGQFAEKIREFLKKFPRSRGPLAGQQFGWWLLARR